MNLLRQLLPYLFLLFFIVKANKERLYLLGIPFLIYMSNSIFFDGVKLFSKPGSISYMLLFLWLTLLWIFALLTRTRPKNKKDVVGQNSALNILDYFIIGLIIISLFDFAKTFINNEVSEILQEFIQLISLFLGYFIIKNWISYNKKELVIKFLFSLIFINSIASILYLLHQGLNLKIYLDAEYIEDSLQGVDITRSFYFMPQFLFFSITFLLIFKEKYPLLYRPLLIINLLAVFITYTRSYLIIIVLIFMLYFLLNGIKKGRIGLIFKNILLYSLLAVFGIFILSKIFPAKSKYFMDRFSELSKPSTTQDPNNLQYRFMNTGNIISNMDTEKKIFGMGPVTENQYSLYSQMKSATADMVWTGVIFRWGFSGLMLFVLLYIFSITHAFKLYMRSEGLLSDLALLLLIYLISQIMESFVSWTFMSGHGLPTGLWYFAILSWLIGFRTKKVELLPQKNQAWNFG